MIKNFELVIGIEIHLELKTKTKMFSAVKNEFNANPNSLVSAIDLGYPGTLPTINKAAVISAIKLAKALKMEIDNELHFDRKNYFYTDLPKGFQITQQFRPIGKNGEIEINLGNYHKKIRIERIHLEEDTAKQHHNQTETWIDYNRAGVPLIEIVSYPDIRTKEEACKYVDSIRQIAKFLNISDAIMAEGSLRADVNMSLKMVGDEKFGTKVEIKNLNSLNNIKKAIEYEYNFQVAKVLSNQEIIQETKRFDESDMKTISLRLKTDAIDYKYFPDPNIPIIKLDNQWIDSIKIGELPEQMRKRYKQLGISDNFVEQLIENIEYSRFIDEINFHNVEQSIKIFFSEIIPFEKKKNILIRNLNIKPNHIKRCLELQDSGEISGKQIKQIISIIMSQNELDVDEIIKKYELKLISDETTIIDWIRQVEQNNPNLINDFKNKEDATTKFIAGEIMKISKGQVNPVVLIKMIKKVMMSF